MKTYYEDDMELDIHRNLYTDSRGNPLTGMIIFDTDERQYVVDGQIHRVNGPGIVNDCFTGRSKWYLNDIEYSFEVFIIKAEWTDEQIVEWKLTHETV